MKIIIAPYSARLPSGKPNPKNYPYWNKLVSLLKHEGYEVIQIGTPGEAEIAGVNEFIVGASYDQLVELVSAAGTWISVDNFFPHFVHAHHLKPGVVLFGQSDPRMFGYRENTNLLRGRDYLRQYQYDTWEAAAVRPEAFVYAENVLPAVLKLAPLPLRRLVSV